MTHILRSINTLQTPVQSCMGRGLDIFELFWRHFGTLDLWDMDMALFLIMESSHLLRRNN